MAHFLRPYLNWDLSLFIGRSETEISTGEIIYYLYEKNSTMSDFKRKATDLFEPSLKTSQFSLNIVYVIYG